MIKAPTLRGATIVPAVFAVLSVPFLSGCDGPPPRQKVYTVTGRVLARGAPAGHAKVFLVPLGDDRDALRPRATTAEDGTFAVTTYEPSDGAPAGDYAVGITWRGPRKGQETVTEPDPAAKDFGKDESRFDYFKNRYRDPKTSGLKIKVDAGATVLPDFDLK
ncbi:hypothetical protein [Frigoriglobus tundricola]|uniref:Carboxypeptidase regulatory-like domain-containing protein n=1 Tax=Frigoriglobus tundricola TaxID=2774151 RepID=A0A6M5Z624_9BACT|nr:hypothetical protein [Frigoriglobus tundricola]QJX01145.1 hypothetical protein FTUN_8784 [Frigoriglobus tundricola]